ncbi:hypothetical protein COY95_00375 [Candidatus Woesearchaeota archaeon CG_4_10_14_0_8_um_filter_47_5]|nr:MAG: hypothetical protein COY95_00375 [Candidatus Woesearchaeota archaeon CG_4_10_14_0_8_um_filter_47_5]
MFHTFAEKMMGIEHPSQLIHSKIEAALHKYPYLEASLPKDHYERLARTIAEHSSIEYYLQEKGGGYDPQKLRALSKILEAVYHKYWDVQALSHLARWGGLGISVLELIAAIPTLGVSDVVSSISVEAAESLAKMLIAAYAGFRLKDRGLAGKLIALEGLSFTPVAGDFLDMLPTYTTFTEKSIRTRAAESYLIQIRRDYSPSPAPEYTARSVYPPAFAPGAAYSIP